MNNEKFIDGLKAIAVLYEAHPELPLPYEVRNLYEHAYPKKIATAPQLIFFNIPREEIAAIVRATRGEYEKVLKDQDAVFNADLGAFRIYINAKRAEVCRAVVKKRIVPEHEEDVVEWECEPVLGEGE